MSFLFDQQIADAIQKISNESNPSFAVAFWGHGAERLFGDKRCQDVRIICNLSMGGTNPDVIKSLQERGMQVRHHDHLHAKVYLGTKRAVVTSANASANGLGFEGTEMSGWKEAGALIQDSTQLDCIRVWFGELWHQSKEVTPNDLSAATAVWEQRQQNRPQGVPFEQFQLHPHIFPLINWTNNYSVLNLKFDR